MSNASGPQQFQIGAHTLTFEPPDLVLIKMTGDVSAANIAGLGEKFRLASDKFYVIIDLSESGSWDTKLTGVLKNAPLASGIAMVNASRQMQFVLSLLNKVYMMVNLGKDSPMAFVASEAEARDWVIFLRQGASAKQAR